RSPRAAAGTSAGRGTTPRPPPPGCASRVYLLVLSVVGCGGLHGLPLVVLPPLVRVGRRGLPRGRDAQREGRAAPRLGPHRDLAAVVGRDVLDDAQPQARAPGVARARRVHAVEPLEDARLLVRRDADPDRKSV